MEIKHCDPFYKHHRKGDDLFDDFHDIVVWYDEGELHLMEGCHPKQQCRKFNIQSGHLEKMQERIEVDTGYVYDTTYYGRERTGAIRLYATYDVTKKAVHIEKRVTDYSGEEITLKEVWVTLKEMKDTLREYKRYLEKLAKE